MPRKVGLPPVIFKIESLSDGREIRDKTFVSDFDGKVLPMMQDPRPPRVMKSGNQILAEQKQKRIDEQALLLAHVGLGVLVGIAKPEPKPAKPSLPYQPGHRAIKLGNDLVMQAPLPPYRRW